MAGADRCQQCRGRQGRARLWSVLKLAVTPMTIAGVKVYRIVPPDIPPENRDRLLVHVHGGAYVFFGGDAATGEAAMVAAADEDARHFGRLSHAA